MALSSLRRAASVVATDVPLAACLIGLDVAARLLPHAPNLTPVAASAVFAGAVLRSKASALVRGRALALAVPLSAMLLGDLVLGGYDWRVMSVVYASLALPALLGRLGRGRRLVLAPIVLSSSLIFFVTTNFAVWAFSGMYPGDLAGSAGRPASLHAGYELPAFSRAAPTFRARPSRAFPRASPAARRLPPGADRRW